MLSHVTREEETRETPTVWSSFDALNKSTCPGVHWTVLILVVITSEMNGCD